MEAVYKKDLYNNYLVLPKDDECDGEAYCVHMLQANSIEGIIKPELRTIDNKVLYYYDIKSKQSIETLYVKNTINYEQIKKLFINLVDLIWQTYEFLLNENDLVLEPEYIYIAFATGSVNVCYLPGYNNDIRKQLATLIEYIMNKVEYDDKEAVLYVYNLYAVCRDEGFSYDNLISAIREVKTCKPVIARNKKNSKVETEIRNKQVSTYINEIPEAAPKEQSPKRQIPVMMEKVSEDREQYYYALKTYIYTGACAIGAILVLIISINTRIVYTSIGNRIDYGKLMALLLILMITSGYMMKNIWDKKNRLTRIISKQEYIDPRIEYSNFNNLEDQTEQIKSTYKDTIQKKKSEDVKQPEEYNPTILLNVEPQSIGCCLKPENKDVYEIINIREFPYIIGKQKDNVDYFLDKEVVSRYHVKITREDDIYYITDLNSTNGTCLNDKPLPCYQRFELAIGDEVTIAGIKYSFKVNEYN